MNRQQIYEHLERLFRNFEKRLDDEGRVELDGLLDEASRELSAGNSDDESACSRPQFGVYTHRMT